MLIQRPNIFINFYSFSKRLMFLGRLTRRFLNFERWANALKLTRVSRQHRLRWLSNRQGGNLEQLQVN